MRYTHGVLVRCLERLKIGCLIAVMVSPAIVIAEDCNSGCEVVSREGHFRISVSPVEGEVPLRDHHDWVLDVWDTNNNPVKLDGLSITGGMPGHGHGLPSQPRVSEYLGEGRYRLTGFLFNMHGDWILRFHLVRQGVQDVADLELTLDY
ncbi:FixH family protein [Marinobacter sp. OP 3.4]|uniref:FixH family protein n=1 Tax=Marinobacter sp. OP 3.4 TaxID=3076501 RepID=UPI002E1FFFB0